MSLLRRALGPKGMPIMSQMAVLMDKMRSVEAEIEAELAKQREALRFHFENRRVVFEKEVLEIHRAIKTRASRYFFAVSSPVDSAAMNASWGTSTRPTIFIRFLPSFCFSRSLRLRVMSPP